MKILEEYYTDLFVHNKEKTFKKLIGTGILVFSFVTAFLLLLATVESDVSIWSLLIKIAMYSIITYIIIVLIMLGAYILGV